MSGGWFRDGASFNSCTVGGSVWLDETRFFGLLDFVQSDIGGIVLLQRARLQDQLHFYGARVGGQVIMRSAIFGGAVECGHINAEALLCEGALFQGRATFSGMTLISGAAFDRATFRDEAHFVSARIGGDATFLEATFANGATFDGASVDGYLHMDRIDVSNRFDFAATRVSRSAFFTNALFDATALVIHTEVGGLCGFSGARFSQEVRFDNSRIGGALNLDRATFAENVSLDRIIVSGNTYLRSTSFSASLSLIGARINGSLDLGPAPRSPENGVTDEEPAPPPTSIGGDASLEGTTIERSLHLGDAVVHGAFSMSGVTIHQSAHLRSTVVHGPAHAVSATIARDFRIDSCEFRDSATFSRLDVGGFVATRVTQFFGPASFADSTIRAGLLLIGTFFLSDLTLRDTTTSSFSIAPESSDAAMIADEHGHEIEVKTHFRGRLDLRGLTYTELTPWREWHRLMRLASPHDRQPYVHLEEMFRRRGLDETADRVYYARRTREFELFKKRRPLSFLTTDLFGSSPDTACV
jgi:hypothetical protein